MIALADLVERFGPALRESHAAKLLPSHLHALNAMQRCRSKFAPRMLAQCSACGLQRSVPHSCGHRACPHCQHHDSQAWIERQLKSLVPATYFLITFTLPAQLRSLAWHHQREVYAALMQTAWNTLNTFSHNDRQLAASAGAVGVLHTHTRRLDLHPHVHMVMPAAALDSKRGLWRTKHRRPSKKAQQDKPAYLFNHKALAKVFRAKLMDALKAAGLRLPVELPEHWVVDCKAVGDGAKALVYLGRYLYRGVIQEKDILGCDDKGNVTFQYRDAKTTKLARRTLPGADFLWLVLQHVLPKGLRRARNFGYLHPNSASAIRVMQLLHLRPSAASPPPPPKPRPAMRCTCGQPMAIIARRRPPLHAAPTCGVTLPDKPSAAQAHNAH